MILQLGRLVQGSAKKFADDFTKTYNDLMAMDGNGDGRKTGDLQTKFNQLGIQSDYINIISDVAGNLNAISNAPAMIEGPNYKNGSNPEYNVSNTTLGQLIQGAENGNQTDLQDLSSSLSAYNQLHADSTNHTNNSSDYKAPFVAERIYM